MWATPAGTFVGQVDPQARLRLDHPPAYTRFVRRYIGRRLQVVISPFKGELRSLALNRYYWGIVLELLAEHCGYTREEMHEALKFKFLRMEAESDVRFGLPKVGSTAQLTNAEFLRYLEDVRIFAATELGLYIPEPNEGLE